MRSKGDDLLTSVTDAQPKLSAARGSLRTCANSCPAAFHGNSDPSCTRGSAITTARHLPSSLLWCTLDNPPHVTPPAGALVMIRFGPTVSADPASGERKDVMPGRAGQQPSSSAGGTARCASKRASFEDSRVMKLFEPPSLPLLWSRRRRALVFGNPPPKKNQLPVIMSSEAGDSLETRSQPASPTSTAGRPGREGPGSSAEACLRFSELEMRLVRQAS